MKTFRRFDPASGRYETLAPMPEALNHIGLVADGDDIYVVGGHGNRLYGGDVRNSLFRYSVAEDRWTRLADMPTARGALAVGIIDGKLYAAGGMTGGRPLGHAVKTLEVYDIATDRWSRGPDMPTAREHIGGTVLDGRLYVLGGRDARTDALGTATRFDPESGEWESLPPLRVAAGGLEAVNEGGAVLALGGGDDRGGTVTGAVQRFEPSRGPLARRLAHAHAAPRLRRDRRRLAHLHLRRLAVRAVRRLEVRGVLRPGRGQDERARGQRRHPDPGPLGAGLARRRRRAGAGGRGARADRRRRRLRDGTSERLAALGDPRLRVLRHERPRASRAPATTGSRPPPGAGPRSWTTTTTGRRASCASRSTRPRPPAPRSRTPPPSSSTASHEPAGLDPAPPAEGLRRT